MAAYTAMGLISYGFPIQDTLFTYGLAASIDVVADLGKALTFDATTTNQMRLALRDDTIHGILMLAEDRGTLGKVGTVGRLFKEKLPAQVGHTIILGDSVTGNTTFPGNVLTLTTIGTHAAKVYDRTVVIEVGTNYVVVEAL